MKCYHQLQKYANFNSTIVRLKDNSFYIYPNKQVNFNSTIVRLKELVK